MYITDFFYFLLSYLFICFAFIIFFFFFKQKTAYEMRISDWSSDVCSSDLRGSRRSLQKPVRNRARSASAPSAPACNKHRRSPQIGRASCRERVCQYV